MTPSELEGMNKADFRALLSVSLRKHVSKADKAAVVGKLLENSKVRTAGWRRVGLG